MASRNRHLLSRCWFNSSAVILRAIAIFGIACPLLASAGWADERAGLSDGWAFPSVALEVRRLPPTQTGSDPSGSDPSGHNQGGQVAPIETRSDSSDHSILPVSLDTLESSRYSDQGGELGPRLYLGYDNGFVIGADEATTAGDSSVDFLMRVNGWMHFRETLFESDGPNADQQTFSLERLRLTFGGHVLSPDLKYFVQFDGNSDRSTDVIFLDYFAKYDLGHGRLGLDRNRLDIKFGKWKVPFTRSRQETGRKLQFSDRATANIFFDLNRSIGIGTSSQFDAHDGWGLLSGPSKLHTAIFNGGRTGSVATGRGQGLDRNFGMSMRGEHDLLSDFGNDGEADLGWHCEPTLRLGGGLAFLHIDTEGATEFSRERVVDSGAALSSILPPAVTGYDVWMYTLDAHFKYHGFSIIGEYYWRTVSQFKGDSVPDLLDDGFNLQGGYFLIAEKLEMIARWSRIAGDSGSLGLTDASSDELGAGFVWYMKGNNAKLTFDATHLNGVPVSSARLDLLPGDAGWLFRTQFQLAF